MSARKKPAGHDAWPKCYGCYQMLSDTCPKGCPPDIARQCKECKERSGKGKN